MKSRRLSIRVPDPLLSRLEFYLTHQGLTLTEGGLATIASYVGDTERLSLVERVTRLEKKLAWFEGMGNTYEKLKSSSI